MKSHHGHRTKDNKMPEHWFPRDHLQQRILQRKELRSGRARLPSEATQQIEILAPFLLWSCQLLHNYLKYKNTRKTLILFYRLSAPVCPVPPVLMIYNLFKGYTFSRLSERLESLHSFVSLFLFPLYQASLWIFHHNSASSFRAEVVWFSLLLCT